MHIIMNGASHAPDGRDSRMSREAVAAPQVERLAALPKLKDLLLAGNPICTKGEPPTQMRARTHRPSRATHADPHLCLDGTTPARVH